MKLAFYIDSVMEMADLKNPCKGNPGIGGTQFCFGILIERLATLYSKTVSIIVLSERKLSLPSNVPNVIVPSKERAVEETLCRKIDFLILKTELDKSFYNVLEKYKEVRVVLWSHNYFNAKIARCIYLCPQVVANVFVGKQQYDFYFDNDVIKKSTYIFNPVPDVHKEIRKNYDANTLVYMGNITKDKGILSLLEIWKLIERRNANAKLYVIGKGSLYDRDAKMGALGIAEEKLEEKMRPYIIDKETGEIKDNIHFLGLLGTDKYDIFRHCAVGIVNPTAKTETFGMGIIEMASVALPVVTKGWNGHFDTIQNKKTGLLAFTNRGIANKILYLFANESINRNLGVEAKKRQSIFNPDLIAGHWFNLLHDLNECNPASFTYKPLSHPYWNNYKWLRYISFILRVKMRMHFMPSIVDYETHVNNTVKKVKAFRNSYLRCLKM